MGRFFEGKLSDGTPFSVFADEKIDDVKILSCYTMARFGWKLRIITWTAPQDAREKLGHLY